MSTIADDICVQCMECDNECNDLCCLTNSMDSLNVNNNINTIMIAKLAEKLTKEMTYNTIYDLEEHNYTLNVVLPMWFYDLDKKYQNILIKLIEPVLNHYIIQENTNN